MTDEKFSTSLQPIHDHKYVKSTYYIKSIFLDSGIRWKHTINIVYTKPGEKFDWFWEVENKKCFNTTGEATTLNEMYQQLVNIFNFKSSLRSPYKMKYITFVGDYWPLFCIGLINQINSNDSFFVSLLKELAKDANDSIRVAVAKCPYTPFHIKERLFCDPVKAVKTAAYNSIYSTKTIYSKQSKKPEDMDFYEFNDWINTATLNELDTFSRIEFKEDNLSLFQRIILMIREFRIILQKNHKKAKR